MNPRVLAFDVFGTVVDWRAGIASESARFLRYIERSDLDPFSLADAWRARYQPAMAAVRDGKRAFVVLDVLHREMLENTLSALGVDVGSIKPELLHEWTCAWHRLDPWPDTVKALRRLRDRFPIVTLSNGNIALMLAMARRARLPWDAILGAEVTRCYKPMPASYTKTADILGILPAELCLVAAHHSDLAAARRSGLLTAYVDRPDEFGGTHRPDAHLSENWDWTAASMAELADKLGC